MKDLLLKKGDESDAVRLNNFNNFITQLDREDKLSYMFGKKGRDEIVDLRDVIKDVLIKEEGAINYSNTGGVVLRGLEKLQALRFPGAQSAAEIARTLEVKGKVKEALKQPNAMAPTNKNALANEPFRIEIRGTGKK
jgi:IS4 transposase